jgi:hypothetical protein
MVPGVCADAARGREMRAAIRKWTGRKMRGAFMAWISWVVE